MRIAMLSWRYLGHAKAGGAEVMTHEILRRLVAMGHEVTAFSAADGGSDGRTELDGVRLVRAGRQWTVHLHAWRWLRARGDQFDRVVDQINTIPFFTPWYVPADRRRGYIYQLAREYWWRETRGAFRLIAPVGFAAEPLYMRLYGSTRMITISESTADDLRRLGVASPLISIVPPALTFAPLKRLDPRRPGWRIVMLGRLTPAKYVEEGIQAFALVKAQISDAELLIAGRGDARYEARLRELVARLGVTGVSFIGPVTEREKFDLLRSAHVHLFTSHREGWGLVVSEAAAVGTPSVGYEVPGVRDSIADPRVLASPVRPEALAAKLLDLAMDGERYEDVRRTAWERVGAFSYDASAKHFAEALQ